MKMTKIILAGLISIAALSTSLSAEEHTIKMLNKSKKGMMVFKPATLNVAKGDTIKFVPTDPGHNVASVYSPEGGAKWESEAGKEITITLDKEGTYIYKCNPHAVMAMVGVIKVGDKPSSDAAKEAAKKLTETFVMNKDRLENYMKDIDTTESVKAE